MHNQWESNRRLHYCKAKRMTQHGARSWSYITNVNQEKLFLNEIIDSPDSKMPLL